MPESEKVFYQFADVGKWRIKKTEKARAFEDNFNSDGLGKKIKWQVEKAQAKNACHVPKPYQRKTATLKASRMGTMMILGGK